MQMRGGGYWMAPQAVHFAAWRASSIAVSRQYVTVDDFTAISSRSTRRRKRAYSL